MAAELGSVIAEMMTPELLPLAVVLYLVGLGLKKAQWANDNYIPMILGGISIVFTGLWVFSTNEVSGGQEITGAVLTTLMQGVLYAGASTYIHEIIKHIKPSGQNS